MVYIKQCKMRVVRRHKYYRTKEETCTIPYHSMLKWTVHRAYETPPFQYRNIYSDYGVSGLCRMQPARSQIRVWTTDQLQRWIPPRVTVAAESALFPLLQQSTEFISRCVDASRCDSVRPSVRRTVRRSPCITRHRAMVPIGRRRSRCLPLSPGAAGFEADAYTPTTAGINSVVFAEPSWLEQRRNASRSWVWSGLRI